MPRRKIRELAPVTPRAREVVTFVVNAVALGSQDNDGAIGVIAEKLGTTRMWLVRSSPSARNAPSTEPYPTLRLVANLACRLKRTLR